MLKKKKNVLFYLYKMYFLLNSCLNLSSFSCFLSLSVYLQYTKKKIVERQNKRNLKIPALLLEKKPHIKKANFF